MYNKILEFIEKTKEKWENSPKFKIEAITVCSSFMAYVLGIIACVLAINAPFPIIALRSRNGLYHLVNHFRNVLHLD